MKTTLTVENGQQLSDELNRTFQNRDGKTVLVNGREVWVKWNGLASTRWGTGSVCVRVRGRRTRTTQGELWVKVGQQLTVEVR